MAIWVTLHIVVLLLLNNWIRSGGWCGSSSSSHTDLDIAWICIKQHSTTLYMQMFIRHHPAQIRSSPDTNPITTSRWKVIKVSIEFGTFRTKRCLPMVHECICNTLLHVAILYSIGNHLMGPLYGIYSVILSLSILFFHVCLPKLPSFRCSCRV